jgi:acyl-CoA dehydrogenase
MEEPMTDLDAFRAEARAWLDANCPSEMRGPIRNEADIVGGGKRWVPAFPAQRDWLDAMAARGWTVPEWPTEYGGGGLTRPQVKVLREEMARIGARKPIVSSMGISMLGPALLKYGTEAQKREHLPPIARGDIAWAQGYSEPNAGSDLASLMTRCEDMGDHYQVTGQKIWTSGADKADWIFVLVRTDRNAPKHLGISFVLVDMAQKGVEVRPIKLISGRSPFCETFFDAARSEKHNLVGELNTGWTIAKYLLTHEREMIGEVFGAMQGRPLGEMAVDLIGVDTGGRLADSFLRADIARAEIDAMSFMATLERVTDQAKAGQGVGAESSTLKYYGTEMNKRRNELLMDCGGSDALEWDAEGDAARHWLRSKGNSIEGGTTEVQLNIIAKRVLGLPSN